MTETGETIDPYLWDCRHKVLYRLELSVLYHQKRERFFDFGDKLAKSVSVIGGSAALARVASDSSVTWILAGITVFSTFSLVMGFSERARRHSELSRNFKALQAEILGRGIRDLDDADTEGWESRFAMIEASEPPALGILVRICQNELARARNFEQRHVRWFDYLLAHFVDLPLAKDKAEQDSLPKDDTPREEKPCGA